MTETFFIDLISDYFNKPDCGKTLSEIITPSSPNYYPLYEKRDRDFSSDQKYANFLFAYIKKSETKLTREETIEKLKIKKNLFNNKTAKIIFNRLISDKSCLDKIVFVNDGSYRTARIWDCYGTISVEIMDEKNQKYRSMYLTNKDPEQALKAFYTMIERYEKIFIQV